MMRRRRDEELPFLDHLDELRSSLIKSVGILFFAVLGCIWPTPYILDLLKAPLANLVEDPDRYLQSLEVAGAFTSTARIAFWSGLIISLPFIVFFVGQFIFPGLKKNEKKVAVFAGGASILLFVFGVYLGYSISLEVALRFMHMLHRWLGIEPQWTLSSYVTFSMNLLIGFGLAFQLPLLVFVLGKLGIVTTQQLAEKRRHVFIGILVLAMFLTPPDPFTQMILTVPLYILFELCILLLRTGKKKTT